MNLYFIIASCCCLRTMSLTFRWPSCRITAFFSSDQNRAATKLISAYSEGDIEEIKRVAQSGIISNLDNVVIF